MKTVITKSFQCPDCNICVFVNKVALANDGKIYLMGYCFGCQSVIAVDIEVVIAAVNLGAANVPTAKAS